MVQVSIEQRLCPQMQVLPQPTAKNLRRYLPQSRTYTTGQKRSIEKQNFPRKLLYYATIKRYIAWVLASSSSHGSSLSESKPHLFWKLPGIRVKTHDRRPHYFGKIAVAISDSFEKFSRSQVALLRTVALPQRSTSPKIGPPYRCHSRSSVKHQLTHHPALSCRNGRAIGYRVAGEQGKTYLQLSRW